MPAAASTSSATETSGGPPRARRWQFRLRTLLAISTIASVIFGTIGLRWQRHRSMTRAVAVLNEHDAATIFVRHQPSWLPQSLAAPPDLIAVECVGGSRGMPLKLLAEFSTLERLIAPNATISPAGLAAVAGQKHLNYLDLSNSPLDDEDLRPLANLKRLVQLDLSGTRITDMGIRHIGSLTSLESLRLDRTDITDAAVESLLRLSRLKTLCVAGTRITDHGLHKLESSLEGLVVLDD